MYSRIELFFTDTKQGGEKKEKECCNTLCYELGLIHCQFFSNYDYLNFWY